MPEESWLAQEKREKSDILEAFWNKRVLNPDTPEQREHSLYGIKNHFLLALPAPGVSQDDWTKRVNQAWSDGSAFSSKEKFFQFFDHIASVKAVGIAEALISVPKPITSAANLTMQDFEPAKQYAKDKKITVSAFVGSVETNVLPLCSENYTTSDVFTTQSVTKIFTGVLAIRMLEEGIISTDDLDKPPIQIADSTKALLTIHVPLVEQQMEKTTLHQALTHYAGLGVGESAGFGEYYANYIKAIETARKEGHAVPEINGLKDFIPLIDNAVLPSGMVGVENRHYSNSGIILAALSLEHLYNQHRLAHPEKNLEALNFDGILKKYVTGPSAAQMTCFEASSQGLNPRFNPTDLNAEHMIGSPGGGYFSTAEDLQKFSAWMYHKCHDPQQGPQLVQLIEQYGQEFCPYPQSKTIEHTGDGPSNSAFFSFNWETGNTIIVLNDQRAIAASEVGRQIQSHLLSSKQSAAELFHPDSSSKRDTMSEATHLNPDEDAQSFRYF